MRLAVMEPNFAIKPPSRCLLITQTTTSPFARFISSRLSRKGEGQLGKITTSLIRMAEKRKYRHQFIPTIIDNNLTYFLESTEMRKLTKVANSSDFTCHYCSKSFNSAQAMGGHQNAHRGERLEEKRLFVKDPIGYRKRAFLHAMNATNGESSQARGGNIPPGLDLNAALEMGNHELDSINGPPNASSNGAARGNNNLCQSSDKINGENLKIFLPVKELSLAENVGVHAEDGKGKGIMEFGFGGFGASSENLDLTLKL